jgi:hypothetical protein
MIIQQHFICHPATMGDGGKEMRMFSMSHEITMMKLIKRNKVISNSCA